MSFPFPVSQFGPANDVVLRLGAAVIGAALQPPTTRRQRILAMDYLTLVQAQGGAGC